MSKEGKGPYNFLWQICCQHANKCLLPAQGDKYQHYFSNLTKFAVCFRISYMALIMTMSFRISQCYFSLGEFVGVRKVTM